MTTEQKNFLFQRLYILDPPALTRLGVGGSGSGAPFHDHDVVALNMAFAGRKRWLVTPPCRPSCRIPFFEGGAAVYHPEVLLSQASVALRTLGSGADTWDCVQYPGEAVFVPAMFLHATVNLDESVAVAVQCMVHDLCVRCLFEECDLIPCLFLA